MLDPPENLRSVARVDARQLRTVGIPVLGDPTLSG